MIQNMQDTTYCLIKHRLLLKLFNKFVIVSLEELSYWKLQISLFQNIRKFDHAPAMFHVKLEMKQK
jgi:hypothetical protein